MLKQAFRSYLSAIHPRNIKKIKENGNWFWVIYFSIIYPTLMGATNPNFGRIMLFTMVKMIPFFLMGWSNISSKFLMSKAMYLCPMKQEERKEYINCVLFIKIGFPVLIGIIVELIWSIFHGFYLWQIITIAFIHFSIGIATYICLDAPDKNDQRISFARKDKKGRWRWAWMNIILLVWAVFLLAGFELIDMTEDMDLGSLIVMGISLVAFVIFDITIIVTQYRRTIELAGDYELNFKVLSKVPTSEDVEFDIFKNKR